MTQLRKRTLTVHQEDLQQLKVAYRRGELKLDMNPLRQETDVFPTEEEYERTVNSVVARIRNGEILPSAEDEE